MKQLLVLLFLVSSMACFGQNKDALKDISSVTFYGIDFTRAKVYGAKEGPMQFKYTFDDINKLFITEPKKYDIGKRLGVNVEVTSLESARCSMWTINLWAGKRQAVLLPFSLLCAIFNCVSLGKFAGMQRIGGAPCHF